MTPGHAATISAEMAEQRAAELAVDDRQYKLRKACSARAVELFEAVKWLMSPNQDDEDNYPEIYQLLKEIEHEAE